MQELDSCLKCPRLDATIVFEKGDAATEEEIPPSPGKSPRAQPIFSLASLNPNTAPSAEVRWSQLLALTLRAEGEPVLCVGRAQECGLRLKDPRASQRHFEIVACRKASSSTSLPGSPTSETTSAEALAYECRLVDRSSNGTSVNGEIVGKGSSRTLRSGDEICVLPSSKVGDDEMIGFLFRNTTESFAEPEEVKRLELDELIVCPICMQAIYKCVALAPCAHNFCMACLSEWMARRQDCPVCRKQFMAILKNHPMDAVIEACLEATPELRRPEEELKEMDEKDKLKLGCSGKLVRDVCAVSATASVPSQAHGAGRAPRPQQRSQTVPAGGAGGASGGASGGKGAGKGAGRGAGRANDPRAGSQVCALQ